VSDSLLAQELLVHVVKAMLVVYSFLASHGTGS
jgi:hypothetical protein